MANKNIGRARILQELKNMEKDKVQYLHAEPLETDLYTWHFTFRGPQNTDFHQGLYHGQIILPFQYPFKPPDIIFANKNGRFEVNTKICLTITQYHTQQWNSAWTIRTMLQAVISLFNERVVGHGYLQSSNEVRKFFAKASQQYTCEKCGKISDIIKPREPLSKLKQENAKAQSKKIEQNQQTKLAYKQIQKQKPKLKQKQLEQKKYQKYQKQVYKKEKRQKKYKNKVQPHQFFYQTLLQGNQEYLSVIRSKKLINQ